MVNGVDMTEEPISWCLIPVTVSHSFTGQNALCTVQEFMHEV